MVAADVELSVASSQVKGAVLLAGLQASGTTRLTDLPGTRDHTERGLQALGVAIGRDGDQISITKSTVQPFDATVPGDPSSAAFLLGAAAVTGGALRIDGVGLNPSRISFLGILERMGCDISIQTEGDSVGEPWGSVSLASSTSLRPVDVGAEEAAGLIDEIPLLAALAAHAHGPSRFSGLDELRHKESDRLLGVVEGLRGLGANASMQDDDLVVEGGSLSGGAADPQGDHRLAMAFVVAALGADGPSVVHDIGCSAVSFPGFGHALASLGGGVGPA